MNQTSICIADQFHPASNKSAPPPSLTNIDYTIDREGYVTLKIYDLQGVEIAELVHELKLPGNYSITWDAKDAQNKVYIVYITTISDRFRYTNTKRLVLS